MTAIKKILLLILVVSICNFSCKTRRRTRTRTPHVKKSIIKKSVNQRSKRNPVIDSKNTPTINEVVTKVAVKIVDFGTYLTHGGKKIPNQENATSYYQAQLKKKGNVVVANKGTVFGFRYVFTEFPQSGFTKKITIQVLHPEIINSKTKRKITQTIWSDTVLVGHKDKNIAGWAFEKQNEIVAGKWVIQVLHKKQLIAQKMFTITKRRLQ